MAQQRVRVNLMKGYRKIHYTAMNSANRQGKQPKNTLLTVFLYVG